MKFACLVETFGTHGWFDLATVVQASNERRESLRLQLYRWCKAGKLLSLRRSMYAFSEPYRGRPVRPVELANRLYTPSYLSSYWALGYYGIIPENVVMFTSVTSRTPRTFENDFGAFRYQNVKLSAFFGYKPVDFNGQQILVAEPEKALLDLWHLEKGEWSLPRMIEMRFQALTMVDPAALEQYSARFESPRLRKGVKILLRLRENEDEGAVEL